MDLKEQSGSQIKTYAYLPYLSGINEIVIIDTDTNPPTVLPSVQGGGGDMYGVAVAADGNSVYVTSSRRNNVSVIDTNSNEISKTIEEINGNFCYGIAADKYGNCLYVTNLRGNTVSVVDMKQTIPTFKATVNVGRYPKGVAVSSDQMVYVANSGENTVSVINSTTIGTTNPPCVKTVTVGWNPIGIVADMARPWIYVANSGSDNVSIINTITDSVIVNVPIGFHSDPTGIAVSLDGRVYVTHVDGKGNGAVSVIDTVTNISSVMKTIPVGGQKPAGISITLDGKKAYAVDSGNGNISVIDTAKNKVIAKVNSFAGNIYALGIFMSTSLKN